MSPDITMCEGGNCPLQDDCHRFKAKPSPIQSFFNLPPWHHSKHGAECDYFWPLEVKIKTKKKGTKK